MARTIGLRIKLNGTEEVINDIETLETKILEARDTLRTLDIGSEEFQRLSNEINNTEAQLTNLNKQIETIDTEKFASGFGQLIGGLSAGFAGVTAAVNLFGNDTEEAAERAADAQNLLTIALSIRGAAEIRTGAQIVARTIADKASTAATNATNTATKALFTTLAANPYGVIIAAVGALVSAYFLLRDETEEVTEETKTFNEILVEQNQEIQGNIVKIQGLVNVIKDQNLVESTRIEAYKELQKLVPELSNYTLEQAQNQDLLNQAVQDEITLLKLKAEQKAFEEVFIQRKKEEIRLAEENRKAAELEIEASVRSQLAFFQRQGIVGSELDRIADGIRNNERARRGLNNVESEYEDILKKIAELEGKRSRRITRITGNVQDQTKSFNELISKYKELSSAVQASVPEPEILKRLREITDELGRLKQGDETFQSLFQDIFGLTLENTADVFGDFYDNAREELSGAILKGGDELGNVIGRVTGEAAEKVQKGTITVEAFAALQNLTKQYSNLQKIIQEFPPLEEAIGGERYFKSLEQFLIQSGQVIYEEVGGNVQLIQSEITRLTKLGDKATEAETEKLIKYRIALRMGQDNLIKSEQGLIKFIEDNLRKTTKLSEDQIKIQARARVEALTQLSTTIVLGEEQIRGVLFESQKLQKEIYDEIGEEGKKIINDLGVNSVEYRKYLTQNSEAFRNFVLQNVDKLSEIYKTVGLQQEEFFDDSEINSKEQLELDKTLNRLRLKEYEGFFQKRKIDSEDVLMVEKLLAEQGIDLEKFTAEQKLKIIEDFYNKVKGFREQNTLEAVDETEQLISDLLSGLQEFQNIVGQTASLFAQSYEIELSRLERDYEKTQNSIVGDTEEANKKRIEAEKIYQAEKKEIEKEATIRSLQFQLLQGIADGAQAVLSTLENPILAAIVGGLAAVQVGIIQTQLNDARALAGGGFIVKGNTHEYGGVMASGGINLEGGEVVLNRNTSMDYLPLLSTLNQQGGGQPILNNPSNSLMEERLLQAIAKTRQEPIRAYVLGSEITNSQAINRRLDELSTL